MVLKQSHLRLKRFGVNHDVSFNQHRDGGFPLTTVNKSPCVRGIVPPPFRNFDQLLRRGRRAGPTTGSLGLSAVTQMSARELSTSTNALQYLNPDVPKSESGKLLFDTHAVVRLFEKNGFPTQQAEVMVKVLVRMTNSNMDVIYNDMVTKVLQEIMLQRVMSQIVVVKKDMIILEKSEFSALLAESEDVMNKVRSDTVMDMHLEKNRAKALKVGHDKMLLETRAEIMEMTAEQDRHLTQTNIKIDTEVAGLKTMLEAHKLDTIKYLAGSVFTCLTVVLGFYRVSYGVMADAFSSSSETVIQRVVDVTVKRNTPVEKLEELYQIKETCDFLREHQYGKVALQFPDELLVDSVAIAVEIERISNAKTCCVDEVAAEHVGADCIVHYGSACLSPSKRLPLMYVFERRPVDLEKCTSAFRELHPDTQNDLLTLLSPEYPNLVVSELVVEGERCYSHGRIKRKHDDPRLSEPDANPRVSQFGRQFSLRRGLSITDYSMFYIGQEGATLRNFMMTWNRCSFCSFDPVKMAGRTESVSINRTLMKRYYAIERAKDANVVGILVGTLGMADYLHIIQQLKETIRGAGKKSYMFAMGKLNVPKLANFLEIDIFVLIACPENSLLDSSEFYKPVVTPFEMEVACNKNREWSEEYVTDFRHLLPGGQSHVPLADQQEDGDETDVSLITGALRSSSLLSNEPAVSPWGSSLVPRNQTLTVANTNSAASFLAERSWRGLERRLGQTPVVKAVWSVVFDPEAEIFPVHD
ncbi:hypothetical protein FQN60_007099 [Etheostoma spectabile]|uniref:2-(3-amino-3-carboxypropyl)histidine synthase subunit 2 n=1 Tax=Etheostoma spectabile TaxID=54343 RepID=A0A5J5CFZ5_9PERO|nr:hypothetical protein FQN60_007099 [Etheostoma spectabile]